MQIRVRKYATQIEEILHEGGEPPTTPLLKGAVLAVIENPYAAPELELATPEVESPLE